MGSQYGNLKVLGLDELVCSIDTSQRQSFVGPPTENGIIYPDFSAGVSPYPTHTVTVLDSNDSLTGKMLKIELTDVNGANRCQFEELASFSGGTANMSIYAKGEGNSIGKTMQTYSGSTWYYGIGPLTDRWQRFDVTMTIGAGSGGPGNIGLEGGTTGDTFYVHSPQLEARNFATPFVNGTRSNTQSLYNLIGNQSLDVSTTEFPSSALQFDGVDDYVRIPYTPTDMDGDPIFSIEGVFKRTGTVSQAGPWGVGGNSTGQGICAYTASGQANKISIDLWGRTTFHVGVDYPLNEYVHVVWVKETTGFTTTSMVIYINGTRYTDTDFTVVRNASSTVNLNTSTKGFCLGKIVFNSSSYTCPFEIPMFRIFKNKALTQAEVTNNYNSLRSRFNIT